MGWTKNELITTAYEKLGYISFEYDIDPAQLTTGLNILDSMLASWDDDGIRIGYKLPSSPKDSRLSDDSGIPDFATQAVFTNLAVKIAPTIGKAIAPELRMEAIQAYTKLQKRSINLETNIRDPRLPLGAGRRSRYSSCNYNTFARRRRHNINLTDGDTLDLGLNPEQYSSD